MRGGYNPPEALGRASLGERVEATQTFSPPAGSAEKVWVLRSLEDGERDAVEATVVERRQDPDTGRWLITLQV